MLYDQFGRPIEKTEKRPDRRPLAAAPLNNLYRDYVANGLTPQRLAALLRDADNGDIRSQAELFDSIEERDGHIIGEISKRKNVILDVSFHVTPASEDRKDIAIAEAVETMLDDITDWPDIMVSCQDAVGKGFSSFEIFWDVSAGQAAIEKMQFIEQNRFVFTDPAGHLSKIPRLITETNTMGEDIAPWKTLFHDYGGMSGHPVRNAIFRICAWWYLFKNYAIKDWLVFLEVFGMPLRLGKYDSGSTDADKDALEIAVRTLGSDAAGIISKSTEIEFIETASKGSADLYENLAAFGNREISKAILGATLTAEVGEVGSYAAANTHNDVRLDLVRSDARALATTIRSQIIRPWVGFNYGWDAAVPKYAGELEEPADMKMMSEIFDVMADRMDIPVSHARRVFAIPEAAKGEEVLRPKAAPPGMTPAALGAIRGVVGGLEKVDPNGDEPDAVDLMAARLEKETDPYIQAMLAPVRAVLDKATSLEAFRDALIDAYPDMDAGELGTLIARAMTAAELMGRYEVKADA